jgi:hypothetical protein
MPLARDACITRIRLISRVDLGPFASRKSVACLSRSGQRAIEHECEPYARWRCVCRHVRTRARAEADALPNLLTPKVREANELTWQPGSPIISEQDHLEWDPWRRERILTARRHRRSRLGRIDYADVSSEAGAIIDELRSHARGDFSSILNRVVVEWAAFRNKIVEGSNR